MHIMSWRSSKFSYSLLTLTKEIQIYSFLIQIIHSTCHTSQITVSSPVSSRHPRSEKKKGRKTQDNPNLQAAAAERTKSPQNTPLCTKFGPLHQSKPCLLQGITLF